MKIYNIANHPENLLYQAKLPDNKISKKKHRRLHLCDDKSLLHIMRMNIKSVMMNIKYLVYNFIMVK